MMIAVRPRGDDDPMAGFGHGPDIYLLAMKTGSAALDDAIYSAAHPDSPDATPGVTHADVVKVVRQIAETHPVYGEIANKIADDYERLHDLI